MSSTTVRNEAAWVVHALGFTANPLRRGVDRLLAFATVLAVLLALLAVPLVATVGTMVHEQESQRASQEAATRHQVNSVLVDDPQFEVAGNDQRGQSTSTRAHVEWFAEGKRHAAYIDVPSTHARGDSTPVWIDQSGQLTNEPRSEGTVLVGAVFVAIWLLFILELVCLGAVAGVRRLATGYTSRAWEREWEVVEPRWMWPQQ
jgi:hypothetical protein